LAQWSLRPQRISEASFRTGRSIKSIARHFNRSTQLVRALAWFHGRARCLVVIDRSQQISARGHGCRLFENMPGGVYLARSSKYLGSAGYRHLRLGAHVTSMKAENTEWSAAAGWAKDSQGRASHFLRLNMLKRL